MQNAMILVVDDNEDVRSFVRVSLEQEGFQVTEAVDGSAALAMFDEVKPAVVILDLTMGQPDGFEVCREIRVHGQSKRYTHTRIGVGGRMDTIQCAITLAKLEKFDIEIKKRQEIGEIYNALMDQIGIQRVQQRNDRTSVFSQYSIFIKNRDELQAKLLAANIPTTVHYPNVLNEQSAYKKFILPRPIVVAKKLSESVMSLPMGPYLTNQDQDRIFATLSQSIHKNKKV